MLPTLTLGILFVIPTVQAEPTPTLYAIEDINTKGVGVETRNLVRLTFDRDKQLVKETLISKDQRFFFGRQRLALDRYIVTQFAGVIDIHARKVIHDEGYGDLLGVEDRKVVYRVNHVSRLPGPYYFDLTTHKFGKTNPGEHWDLPGVKSPDKTMSVAQHNGNWGVMRLHRIGKPSKELAKGFGYTYSPDTGPFGEPVPCLWLDAERILTVQTNSKLVILTPQGAVEKFAEINDAPVDLYAPPRLWIDKKGQPIYSLRGRGGRVNEFLIDVRARAVSLLKSYSLGHGFEASVAVDPERRRSVYYDGKAIGQFVFDPSETETAPDLVAFAYVKPGKDANLGQADGVAVWSSRVRDWRTVKFWVNDLIGWVK